MWCSSDMNTLGREVLLFGKKMPLDLIPRPNTLLMHFLTQNSWHFYFVFVVYLPKILKTKFEVSFMKLPLTIFVFDLEKNSRRYNLPNGTKSQIVLHRHFNVNDRKKNINTYLILLSLAIRHEFSRKKRFYMRLIRYKHCLCSQISRKTFFIFDISSAILDH